MASDLKMFIDYLVNDYLVNEEKCFTYTELNSYIKQFEYTGNDAANKPTEINFNEAIKESVGHFNFQPGNTLVATEITLKGTKYRKGNVVLLVCNDEGLEVGRIKLILVHQSTLCLRNGMQGTW